jgi:DNA primase
LFCCRQCGAAGDAIAFLRLLGHNFQEAVEQLTDFQEAPAGAIASVRGSI